MRTGANLAGNRDEFVPHMTVVKLGRALLREVNALDDHTWSQFRDARLGSARISGVRLCVMSNVGLADDEFYTTISKVKCGAGAGAGAGAPTAGAGAGAGTTGGDVPAAAAGAATPEEPSA